MITATASRVSSNTSQIVNDEIRRQTRSNIREVANLGRESIDRRLAELDHEWDIERFVETMAPTFTLLGMGLGLTISRKWFALPIIVQAFFLQHALQGWCPPIPILRRLGVRTSTEIDEERHALKAIRGDYEHVSLSRGELRAERAFQAARR